MVPNILNKFSVLRPAPHKKICVILHAPNSKNKMKWTFTDNFRIMGPRYGTDFLSRFKNLEVMDKLLENFLPLR
jgi:hypothetical protein